MTPEERIDERAKEMFDLSCAVANVRRDEREVP